MTPQEHLKSLELQNEANGWLDNITNFSNHRPMLLLALSLTRGRVIELGSGHGSTPYLRSYCSINEREFLTFDFDKEWAEKTGSKWVENWDKNNEWKQQCGVLFVDNSPGEHRHVAIKEMVDLADIICVHDAETVGCGDYKLHLVRPLFKYELGFNLTGGGAGCSLLSNKVDVTKYSKLEFSGRQFD